jgi:DNA invertase Pin-like site-specific DNA recombinase
VQSRAIIYGRISDDEGGEAEAVEKRQLPDCRKFCAEHGLDVVAELTDNDLSASRYAKKARPRYQEALRLLRDGQADVLVAWHLDRLYRQPRELEELVDLAQGERRIEIRTLHGEYDLTNEDHLFMVRLLVNMAAKESGDKSRRLRRKHEQLAEEGKPKGGGRGFGYDDDAQIIEAEAEAIRSGAQSILDGYSARSVARAWNDAGLITPRGNLWTGATARRSLLSARLVGLREHHGEIVGEATWAPILDRETWERLRAVLTDPARTTNGGKNARKWAYSGLVKCGRCGESLKTGVTNGKPAMSCREGGSPRACGGLVVVLEPLAELIRETAFHVLTASPVIRSDASRPDDADHSETIARLEVVREKIARLEDDYYAGDAGFEKGRYLTLRAKLEGEAEALTASLTTGTGRAAVTDLPTTLDGMRAAWDAADVEWQRAVLDLVYVSVIVEPAAHKGQRFTEDRVKPVYQEHVVGLG